MGAPDWKNAPLGATHYSTEPKFKNWIKLDNGEWMVWSRQIGWLPIIGKLTVSFFESLIPRHKEPAAWDGEGLPPVGIQCIFVPPNMDPENGWRSDLCSGDTVTILAHYVPGRDCPMVAVFSHGDPDDILRTDQAVAGCFRPIIAAPQAAASYENAPEAITTGQQYRYKARESLDDAYDPEQVVVVIALDGDHAAIRGEHFRKWVPISHLSPLLTPEEISAEAALDEIARLYHEGGPAAIYDAGYRKTRGGQA